MIGESESNGYLFLRLCLMHHNHYLDLLNKYLGNVHDSKTILAIIKQIKKLTVEVPKITATVQGYRGISNSNMKKLKLKRY